MKNSNAFFFLAFIFGFLTNLFAQDQKPAAYVVLTIEDTYKISQHGTQTYLWIIPVDSIKSYNATLSRLFISGFTRSNLEDCFLRQPFDPLVYDQTPSIAFDSDYLTGLEEVKQLILKKKKRLQKIVKKWESGQTETIAVFATPVVGQFCSSDFHPIGQHRTGYHGKVYLPTTSLEYEGPFWSSEKADYITKRDFSLLDFDIISN